MLNPKEKKEIGLIFASVLVVVIVGMLTTTLVGREQKNFAGAATTRVFNSPDNVGALSLLNEKCHAVIDDGDCNTICNTNICVPLEENCDTSKPSNQCYCCEVEG